MIDTMRKNDRKPVKMGLDYIRGKNWKPKILTRKGAQRLANKIARETIPYGFWHGIVVDCGDYWRINIAH